MHAAVKLTTLALLGLASATPVPAPGGKPGKGNCAKQLENREWSINNFNYRGQYIATTPAHSNNFGYISFDVVNNANPALTVVCDTASTMLTDFYAGIPFDCPLPADAPAGSALQFEWSTTARNLLIRETTVCDGKKER